MANLYIFCSILTCFRTSWTPPKKVLGCLFLKTHKDQTKIMTYWLSMNIWEYLLASSTKISWTYIETFNKSSKRWVKYENKKIWKFKQEDCGHISHKEYTFHNQYRHASCKGSCCIFCTSMFLWRYLSSGRCRTALSFSLPWPPGSPPGLVYGPLQSDTAPWVPLGWGGRTKKNKITGIEIQTSGMLIYQEVPLPGYF